jgi:hypothetical protein
MAVYKVPQDVEAEDKLLGPFSFRQFIYLIVVAIGMAILFFTFRANITVGFVALIPILPVILLFGAIALPLKKDQPMETYLLAIVRFNLKPRLRLWMSDGSMAMVNITAPKVAEEQRAKNLTGSEAESRLSYLASVMDTRGWATRGVIGSAMTAPAPTFPVSDDTEDIMDTSAGVSQSFEKLITEKDGRRRKEMLERMRNPQTNPQTTPATGGGQGADDPSLTYDPYPSAIHQRVVNPLGQRTPSPPAEPPKPDEPAAKPAPDKEVTDKQEAETGVEQLSPDIMRLAENKDLSISAIANEAHRLQEKANSDEVVISLR